MADAQFRLLGERRYGPFFATQAFGALNDNLLKNALVILATYHASQYTRIDPNILTQLAGAIFILPFLLLSATAGQLADKYDKATIMRSVKIAEIAIMAVAAAGFVAHSLPLLLTALFGMGIHSTFFGPAKYGYLPQSLAENELTGGNAVLESGTFLAILLGTLLAGIAARAGTALLVGLLFCIAICGLIASRFIPRLAASEPTLKVSWNPVTTTWRVLRDTCAHRTVFLSLLGISWFWALGGVILSALPGLSRFVIGGDETVVTAMLAIFSISVGAGSLACEKLSRRTIEIGLVPFGSIGLSVALWLLYRAAPAVPATQLSGWSFLVRDWDLATALALIGLFGGFFIIPLYALVQARGDRKQLSRIQAANNALNALALVLAALASGALLHAGVSLPALMLIAAVVNAAVAVYIYTLIPEFLYRFLCWCLVTLLYRFRVSGDSRVPNRGPALLVCNHVSYADALVISAGIRRPVRFVIYHRIYNLPLLRRLFRANRAIPIATREENPALLARAYAEIESALENGELVCVFPEGGITCDGNIAEFRPGLLRILRDKRVPVIPLAISGMWGSVFSRSRWRDKLLTHFEFFRKVYLRAGDSLQPNQVELAALRESIDSLRGLRR